MRDPSVPTPTRLHILSAIFALPLSLFALFGGGHFQLPFGKWVRASAEPIISPRGDVQTSSGRPPRPSLSRCSSCSFRCCSSRGMRLAGNLMVRELRSVLGALTLSLPPTISTACATCKVPLVMSTSDHRKPKTSPRRSPVDAAISVGI